MLAEIKTPQASHKELQALLECVAWSQLWPHTVAENQDNRVE